MPPSHTTHQGPAVAISLFRMTQRHALNGNFHGFHEQMRLSLRGEAELQAAEFNKGRNKSDGAGNGAKGAGKGAKGGKGGKPSNAKGNKSTGKGSKFPVGYCWKFLEGTCERQSESTPCYDTWGRPMLHEKPSAPKSQPNDENTPKTE